MKTIRFILIFTLIFISISHAKDMQKFPSMLANARKGDVEAMCDLGVAYFYGNNTLKDPFKAKCWIKKAYDKGSVRALKLWKDLELWRYSGKCDTSFDDEVLPKYAGGDIFKDPVTGMEFVFISGGCFKMGCDELKGKCDRDETPAHKVCVDGFWMGRYEVTQKSWYDIMGSNPSRFSSDLSRPVENISFDDIQKFIRRINLKTRNKFSLPSEAQWEYACRNGGQNIIFPWGNESYRPEENCGTCNSGSFHGETAPVGSFPPNELGIYDMGGNVKEWCRDVYHKNAYAQHNKNNPVYEGHGSLRVLRGGSFVDNTSKLGCTSRDKSIPGMRSDYIGFRLVLAR
ncbi:MAG: SUMF1/EgtB/PvdO family nonheme iron enzyme [Deltaproteobacteria bacterium]|nr:SUMF1/EgtB/PvdO family nonheme iron enzyme [Deltaproteobacteria bacterium]